MQQVCVCESQTLPTPGHGFPQLVLPQLLLRTPQETFVVHVGLVQPQTLAVPGLPPPQVAGGVQLHGIEAPLQSVALTPQVFPHEAAAQQEFLSAEQTPELQVHVRVVPEQSVTDLQLVPLHAAGAQQEFLSVEHTPEAQVQV